jgi:hypothetical protein
MLNPSMKKMQGGAASVGGILRSKAPSARGSQGGRSKRTGYSQTKSRTSKHEEDWDSMDITEIDVLIETQEKEMEQANAEIRKIRRNKTIPANQKEAKCEPYEDVLKQIRMKIMFLIQLKDSKIPFYDKLPKQNVFYTHYMEGLKVNRMQEVAKDKAEEDRMKFDEASFKI